MGYMRVRTIFFVGLPLMIIMHDVVCMRPAVHRLPSGSSAPVHTTSSKGLILKENVALVPYAPKPVALVPYTGSSCNLSDEKNQFARMMEQCKQQEEKEKYEKKSQESSKKKVSLKDAALVTLGVGGIAAYCDVVNNNFQEHADFFDKEAAELNGTGATAEKYLQLAQNAAPDSMLADLYYATYFALAGDLWQARQRISQVNKKVGTVKEIQQKLASQMYIDAAKKTWENSSSMIDAGRTVYVLNNTDIIRVLVRASMLHTYALCGTYNIARVGHMRTKPEKVQEVEWHHVLVNQGLSNIRDEMNSLAEIPGYRGKDELLHATEKMGEFMLTPSYEQYVKVKELLPLRNK